MEFSVVSPVFPAEALRDPALRTAGGIRCPLTHQTFGDLACISLDSTFH